MVLDPSAVLAILQNEPERRRFNEAIEAAEVREPLLFKGDDFTHCDIECHPASLHALRP